MNTKKLEHFLSEAKTAAEKAETCVRALALYRDGHKGQAWAMARTVRGRSWEDVIGRELEGALEKRAAECAAAVAYCIRYAIRETTK